LTSNITKHPHFLIDIFNQFFFCKIRFSFSQSSIAFTCFCSYFFRISVAATNFYLFLLLAFPTLQQQRLLLLFSVAAVFSRIICQMREVAAGGRGTNSHGALRGVGGWAMGRYECHAGGEEE
jgi:hypothetical protein